MTNITAALTELDTLTSAVADAMAEVCLFVGREEIDYEKSDFVVGSRDVTGKGVQVTGYLLLRPVYRMRTYARQTMQSDCRIGQNNCT